MVNMDESVLRIKVRIAQTQRPSNLDGCRLPEDRLSVVFKDVDVHRRAHVQISVAVRIRSRQIARSSRIRVLTMAGSRGMAIPSGSISCPKLTAVVVLMMIGTEFFISTATAQDTTFATKLCNQGLIPINTNFWDNLGDLLVDLKQNTAFRGYNYRSKKIGGGVNTAYGQAICNSRLSQNQCTKCLTAVQYRIMGYCNAALGAKVQLADCSMRYEDYPFST